MLIDVQGNIRSVRRVTQEHFSQPEIQRVQRELDAAAAERDDWEVDARLRKLEEEDQDR